VIVAEVERGDAVVPTALETQPDVALLDIEMPGGDGLSAAKTLHELLPSCRSVILTTFGRSGYLQLTLSEGTVRNHLSTAIQKLGAHNRMEAARLAEQKGWL
jgi:two-component system response regulator DesR